MSETRAAEAPANVQVKGGVVPYLSIDGAAEAAAFYRKAFGAEVASQHPPDEQGRTMHIHLYLNGGSLMLSDFYREHGDEPEAPAGFHVMLPVTDVEAWFKRAVDAGCTAVLPPQKMFWGDVYGQVKDPFGVLWALNQGGQ